MKLGYARVSTDDQSLEIQHDRLAAAGCERMFEEKISGTVRGRPALEKLIDHLRKGDVLVVTRLDRSPDPPSNSCTSPSASSKKTLDYSRLMSHGPIRRRLLA